MMRRDPRALVSLAAASRQTAAHPRDANVLSVYDHPLVLPLPATSFSFKSGSVYVLLLLLYLCGLLCQRGND